MGDCVSRPNESQIDEHKKKENKKNDKNFVESMVKINSEMMENLTKAGLEDLIEKLEDEAKFFYEKIENCTAGLPSIPEIAVEVQKGVDLYKKSCFSSSKPFVRATLEPKGPAFDTFASNKFLPEWFKLIKINQNLHGFESLRITIVYQSDDKEIEELGYYEFLLAELEDQQVKEGWYKIQEYKPQGDLHPKIRLKIQLIHDIKAVYTVLIKEANEKIDEIQKFILNRHGIN